MLYIKHFYRSPQQYQTCTKYLYLYTTAVGTLHTSVNSNVPPVTLPYQTPLGFLGPMQLDNYFFVNSHLEPFVIHVLNINQVLYEN